MSSLFILCSQIISQYQRFQFKFYYNINKVNPSMDQQIKKKVGDDPRLIVIETYLSKSSKKGNGFNEVKYLKEKGLKYFLSQFGSDPNKGLTDQKVKENQEKYGKNTYKKKKTSTFLEILLQALSDQMLIILMVAAVIQIIVQYFFSDERQTFWLEGVSILCAVAVVSIVASVNDYQKQKQFQELNEIQQSTNIFKGIRNGQNVQIHKNDIVVGDVILVEGGNQLPADSIVITAQQAVVDQGSITGEAIQKYKTPIQQSSGDGDDESSTPVLISGTSLTSGSIKMLVLVVGKDSAAGKLNEQIFDQDNQQQTPLQIKLDALVAKIGKIGVATAIIVFITLTIRLIISDLIPEGWSKKFITEVLKYLILGISIIVVAIPEGLPLAVTLSLAYSVKQMLQQKNLVRKLASCQTMGGAHVICTDKTGTLTQNQMFVVEVWNGKSNDAKTFKKYIQSSQNKNNILNSLVLNTKASLDPKPQGSSTQLALLKFCKDASPQYYKNISQYKEQKVLAMIPFNSDRKRMSTLIQENGTKILLQKGGVEIVLEACEQMEVDGDIKRIDREEVDKSVEQMAKKGLRVIALAYKQCKDVSQIPNMKGSKKSNMTNSVNSMNKSLNKSGQKKDKSGGVLNIEKKGFILQMLVGIQDLPRPQSKDAIQSCHRGGVLVIMVTGDNKLTARAIANQVGITNANDKTPNIVREGKQVEQISPEDSPEKLQLFLKNLKVLARSRPEHKYRLVQCIQKLHNVVAVTGDGTNDAPALMKADVGFSMGVKGTQIAKSASDIIIMDDNFHSIVRALIWGRNIYQSIRKFLQFQLTVNIVACLISVISSIIIRQSVLTAIQMLWVNMIMDSLASLALATEPPNGEQLLDRKPFEKNEPLITKTMIKHIVGQAVFQMIVLFVLLFWGPYFIPERFDDYDTLIGKDLQAKYFRGQPEGHVTSGMFYTLSGEDNYITYYNQYKVYSRHFTFIFTTFVLMQFFNFFNCRRIRDEINIFSNPCSNYLYWIIVAFIFIVQWLIVTFLNVFFKLYKFGGLTFQQWILAICIGALTLIVSQILRAIPIAKPQPHETNNELMDKDLVIKNRLRQDDGEGEENQIQQNSNGRNKIKVNDDIQPSKSLRTWKNQTN